MQDMEFRISVLMNFTAFSAFIRRKDVVITSFFRFVFQVLESFAFILTIT